MKDRIFTTFSGYIIVILIPLSIVFYQGFVSLRNQRIQIETHLYSQLDRVAEDFFAESQLKWQFMLEREKIRSFYHYLPINIPEEELVITSKGGTALTRSPLYISMEDLSHLTQNGLRGENRNQRQSQSQMTPSIDQIFEASLIGYFQFDPSNSSMVTPYDTTRSFESDIEERKRVSIYRDFLNSKLKPLLVDSFNIQSPEAIQSTNILLHMKTKRLSKTKEPRAKILHTYELAGLNLPADFVNGPELVNVSYYDFTFLNFKFEREEYVVGVRPVVLDNYVAIQGFLFNLLLFLQESQSYLEPLQPEFGNVVIRKFVPSDPRPLYEPFSLLAVELRSGEGDKHLQNYFAERNRFVFSLVSLILALGVSMVHLGRLIQEQNILTRKKNDFISAVTHELKAPLTSIIMYIEMLEEGWAKGKEQTYYRYIHSESERLSRLIRNVLDYSGIERGVFRLKKGALLLADFIEETIEPLEIWIQGSGLTLDLKIHANPYVSFDKDSLSQVIFNLVDNAIKYGRCPDREPVFTIEVNEDEESAILSLYDNGPGVAKSEQTEIFRRFYRCENELTRESTGTGLGLALVKELVENNGGEVSIVTPPEGIGFGIHIQIPKFVEKDQDDD